MDNNEVQVPEFVNERYYENKYRESQEEIKDNKNKIRKLKVYNKALKLIAFGAVLVAVSGAPKVQQTVHDVINTVVAKDNNDIDERYEQMRQEVIEMTGRTPEEITEAGKQIH